MRFIGFKKQDNGNNPFVIQQGRLKHNDLGTTYRTSWTEESFIMDQGGKETVGRTFDFDKLKLIIVMLVLMFSIIFGRTAWLQVVKGDYYYKMAEGNRIRIERIEAKRGVIYDRNRVPLARNKANFLLYFIPSDLPKDEKEKSAILTRISEILGSIKLSDSDYPTAGEAKDRLNGKEIVDYLGSRLAQIKRGSPESFLPLFVADNIEYDKAMTVLLESSGWKGVVLSSKTRREYEPTIPSLSHLLGYTGKINDKELKKYGDEYLMIDYIGKTGTEQFWENELKGMNGKKQIEVDALGKEKKIISKEEAQDGHNLVLAIDAGLQKKIEDVMSETLKRLNLAKGSVVALDPNNGEVLAMASFPFYDNNVFARGVTKEEYKNFITNPDRPLFNRIVSGEYPSGSTIKPVMSAAALEEGVIDENTAFSSSGGIRVGQWFFPDWKAGGHGTTNVKKAIAESVNTFFYIIGGGLDDFIGLGVDRIVKYEKLFGLGAQTGIDLAGEATGFLPTKEWKETAKNERWYIGDTYHLAIGQGDLTATPLQVAQFTSFFANGGKLYQPHLVKEILSNNDTEVSPVEANLVREGIIKDDNIEIVRDGMRQTVLAGSARSLQTVPVPVAGKTGTAQWSTKKAPHAWFTGFAPYDKPSIVLTIMVEEGKEGSSVAVPIAREILSWYFSDKAEAGQGATSTPANNLVGR